MIDPLSLALLVSAILTGLLAFHAWERRSNGTAILLAAFFFGAVTLYIGGSAMELAATGFDEIIFWLRVEFLGIAVAPALVIAMVLAYTGRDQYLERSVIAGLLVIPAITLVLALTLHPLYYTSIGVDTSGPSPRFVFEPGLWYAVDAGFNLAAMLFAVVLLALELRSAMAPFRQQVIVVLAGAIIPLVTYTCYILGVLPISGIDPMPFALLATAIAFSVGVVRYRLFELVPVARSVVFERIPVGVLILDGQERVVESNPAAAALLGARAENLIGRGLGEVVPLLPPLAELLGVDDGAGVEVRDPASARTVAVSAVPLCADRACGTVVLLSDVTARRLTEQALARRTADLEASNRRHSLLSTFTRHDLANHLVVVDGYLSLVREDPTGPMAPELLERLSGAVARLKVLSAFIRDYPSIGAHPPSWMDLSATAARAVDGVDPGDSVIENRLPTVLVLADALLERVFSTLIENAVRHGGGTSQIILRAVPDGDGFVVVVEDDGAGIPWPDKERIFERGFGRNTGLGLFLAREILENMEMSITETGLPGHGARFEIRVPGRRIRHRSAPAPEGAVAALAMRHL